MYQYCVLNILPEDGSFEQNHVADVLLFIKYYIVVLLTEINYYVIAKHNGTDPV